MSPPSFSSCAPESARSQSGVGRGLLRLTAMILTASALTACSWPGLLIVHNANPKHGVTLRLYLVAALSQMEVSGIMTSWNTGALRIADVPAGDDPGDYGHDDWREAPADLMTYVESEHTLEIRIPPGSAVEFTLKACCDGYHGEGAWFTEFAVIEESGEISLRATESRFLEIWKRADRARHYLLLGAGDARGSPEGPPH